MDDQLLQQVAEARGMPASLVERSAQARAETTGTTVEAVLREWLGETAAVSAESDVVTTEPTAEIPTPVDTETASPTEVSTDYLIRLAADVRRMPTKLILSSAEARAEHSGSTLDQVLADWAGVDLDELRQGAAGAGDPSPTPATPEVPASPVAEPPAPAEAPAPAPTVATEPAPVAAAAAATGGAALSMDELLAKVAEVKGMPAALAQRSAEARAKKTGEPLEAILTEWAGIDTTTPAPAPAEAPAPAQATLPSTEPPAADDATPNITPDEGGPAVEIIEASAGQDVAGSTDDVGTSPKRGGYPMWLTAAFILIPLLAVTYILVAPNGPDCGSGGQLLVDPATGEAVNCDGGAYGETTVDNFAAGGGLYAQCAACHSGDGSGGVGPGFAAGAILVTFPSGSCADQINWVSLGTAGWPDPTYGATNKQVGGAGLMPGFGASLTEEQVAQVVLYERVAFGGQPLEDAEIDCGLVEASEG